MVLTKDLNIHGEQDDFFVQLKSTFPDKFVNTISCGVYTHVGSPFSVNLCRMFHRHILFELWDKQFDIKASEQVELSQIHGEEHLILIDNVDDFGKNGTPALAQVKEKINILHVEENVIIGHIRL
jgi:hypothetical protein